VTAPLLVIVGPTCVGKTAVAVATAKLMRPAELLNADSRQVRRGLSVATCKPTAEELDGVPCHLLDLCDPGEPFSAAAWLHAARIALEEIGNRGARAVVAGGTGLYVTALVDGYNLALTPADPTRRALREQQGAAAAGLEGLVRELRDRDAEAAAMVDPRNPRRVIRALEILDAGIGSLRDARRSNPLRSLMVGIDAPPEVHVEWVEARVRRMFAGSELLGETGGALRAGVEPDDLAGCGIGYSEAMSVLAGELGAAEAERATVRRTLRYAKAQRTYWRRDRRVRWLRAGGVTPQDLAGQIVAWARADSLSAQPV
jgi:tRNA dimethylallyltransferase